MEFFKGLRSKVAKSTTKKAFFSWHYLTPHIGAKIQKLHRVSSPAILRSILGPIPTGIFIIPVGIAN